VATAGLLVVAGTTTVFDASSLVLGSAPPTETLSCNDSWTGSSPSGVWDSAANWTAGVPNGASVDACITGNANVTLSDSSFSIGELTVSVGSSLTIDTGRATTAGDTVDAGATGATTPGLTISSGLQNDGSLTVGATQTSGHPGLTLDGPVTNSGTLTVDGTVGIGGGTSTAVSNDGTVGVAPGGLIHVDGSSTITNEPDGLLAFGIDGPPSSVADYGQITDGTLALGGSADPVFENDFTPSPGSEYFVDTGAATGAFASVPHGATADYSHTGEVGLTGGAPGTATVTRVKTSTPRGSLFGQPVQLTAVVTPASGAGPTGSVSFSAGGLLLGSSPVTTDSEGVTSATVDVSSLPVGSGSITATYGGDVLFGPSTSPGLTQIVNPDPTNLTIAPSVASLEAGQPVTYTATVAPSSASSGTPTGTISFTDDGSPVSGCQSLSVPDASPLQASCTETFGSGATHSIVATYSGDADDAGSTASLVQALGQIPTQTIVTSSSPGTVYGEAVTLTATVTPAQSAAVTPSGTVTFFDGSTPLATVGVSTTADVATARLDTASLVQGPHLLTATYGGDPTFATSTSGAPVIVSVAEAATTVTVASASGQSVVGQAVVFTAFIASSASGETGTVQFDDNGSLIGMGAVSGGQATLETSSLALGAHPITAIYEGDDNFVGGSSTNTIAQTVNPAATSTEVASAHDPGLVGQTIAYSATVAVTAPGSGTPTGTVSFSDGGSPIPACQELALPASPPLVATCSQSYDTIATQDITASYSGDADFTSSAGAVAQNVSPVSTTTALVSSPAASTSGQSVTLTATVTPTTGTANPDGSVSFSLNGTPLGTSVVSTTSGVTSASMLLTTLPLGSDSVTASYGGGAGFLASSSTATPPITVTKASTTLGVLASADPSTAGQPVMLTATVFPTTGSGETGSVTFFDDGTPIGTSSVSNGQATLAVFTLAAADDSIRADYSGDASFIGSSTAVPLDPSAP